MSAKIEYNGSTVATIESGKVATLPVKDLKMATNIKVTAEKDIPNYFDGTIIIESGLTTISGSYLIDQQKACDVLQSFIGTKTYTMSEVYGGGGIYANTMTFDGTNYLIKYDDVVAFRSDSYMVEGNGFVLSEGARVNFSEDTEVSREFKALFLSIADKMITFTIDGTTYMAVEGMNWGDWTQDFTFNTAGYFPSDKIYLEGNTYIEGVTPNDVITNGGTYHTVSA